MDLRRLAHVVALADEQHFTRAANRVRLSQSAFTRSIQSIESEFGVRLFDRETGNVCETPAGKFVIKRARQLLSDARSLQRDVSLYRDSEIGSIAFGVGPVVAMHLVPRVLTELRHGHPNVTFRVDQANSRHLMEQLVAESIDFFVADVRDDRESAVVNVQPLPSSHALWLVRPGHPLVGKPCRFADAWRYGIASVGFSDSSNRRFAKVLKLPRGHAPVLAVQCNNLASLTELVANTEIILLSTLAAVNTEMRTGMLVPLQVEDLPSIIAKFCIVTLRNRTPSPMAKKAMACIQSVAKELESEVSQYDCP